MEKQVGSGLSFFSGMTGRSSMSGGGGDDMGFDVDEIWNVVEHAPNSSVILLVVFGINE
jgi:hypothetical protein